MNMPWPTADQVKGLIERVVTVGGMYLIAKGYIGSDDAATFGPAIVGLAALVYAWFVNRPKAIAQSAAALPDTTVITSADIAKSTPEANIVSEADNKVERKTAADIRRDK